METSDPETVETASAEEEMELVLDAMPVAVAHCDARERYVFANKAYAARFGLTPGQIVGRSTAEVLGEDLCARIRPYTERVLAGENVQYEADAEYAAVGRLHVHCSCSPVWDGAGRVTGWVAMVTDITERRRTEQERKQAEEALREADRRKDEFLATLAHELRNPLAPIRNAVQILRLQGEPSREMQFAREVIERQVQQLSRLVDDLLDVSRITRGTIELRKERVEIPVLIERALETSRPLIEAARHHLTVTFPAEPLWLTADVTRIAQVLSNLLNNAAKYTQPGGHIELTAEREGGTAVLRVRDNGIGIPREMLSRVFEMFAQVDSSLERAQGGLGIGLTIAQRLVEMHGGTVTAASGGSGQGSELTVRLPLPQESAAPEDREEPAGEPAGAALRVLVVDDNDDSADSLAVWLELAGHDVRTAYDGQQAIAAAQVFRPQVVLLDIGMPGINGYDVARHLREQPATRDVLLLAMTGWGQDEDRRKSREAGFDEHLVKPLDPQYLKDLLARIAART